jgi:hypothetical protein
MRRTRSIYLESVFIVDGRGCPIIDAHGMTSQPMFFFQLAIHEIDGLGVLGRTIVDGLFKEITGSFQFGAALPI